MTDRFDVGVRSAEPAELAQLGAIEVAAGARFREVGLDSVAGDEPPPLSLLAEARRRGHLWVATVPSASGDERELVGYVWVLDLGGQPHLEQISVLPEHGGKGVGIALVDRVVAWARSIGGTSVTLSTFIDVPWNGPWYERLGFVAVDADEQTNDQRWIDLRAHEAAAGLDLSRRTVMRRPLRSPR